jgi:hypothetical protein
MVNNFALNENNELISIIKAVKTPSMTLKCPDCKEKVYIKSKKEIKKQMHFCHYADSNCDHYKNGGGESYNHLRAKEIIYDKFENNEKINIISKCADCEFYTTSIIYKKKDYNIKLEYRYQENINNDRPDITILKGDKIRYIIEIYETHETTKQRPGLWFELRATDVINGLFNCVRHILCSSCDMKKQTKLLIREEEQERYSIIRFYERDTDLLKKIMRDIKSCHNVFYVGVSQLIRNEEREREHIIFDFDTSFIFETGNFYDGLEQLEENENKFIDLIKEETQERKHIESYFLQEISFNMRLNKFYEERKRIKEYERKQLYLIADESDTRKNIQHRYCSVYNDIMKQKKEEQAEIYNRCKIKLRLKHSQCKCLYYYKDICTRCEEHKQVKMICTRCFKGMYICERTKKPY